MGILFLIYHTLRRLDIGQLLPPNRSAETAPPAPEVDAGSETGSESGEAEEPALDHFDFNSVVKVGPTAGILVSIVLVVLHCSGHRSFKDVTIVSYTLGIT